jgi:signal transduction histidine kinase
VGKGSGQGLAISHAVIVDMHQGQLTFETEMGAGTEFIIRLPLHPPPRPKEDLRP